MQRISSAKDIYVAGRGSGLFDGLHRFKACDGIWNDEHLATVKHLSALTWHPMLPIVYGVSGFGTGGFVHAWDVSGTHARTLAEIPSGGAVPCHLAVDANAQMLVVANYATGTLAVWPLFKDGSLMGEGGLIELKGLSMNNGRQIVSHPHYVVFNGDVLLVVDLGADVVHTFAVSKNVIGVEALTLLRQTAVPAGTGPRHLVVLPDGGVALSGEFGSTVLTGYLNSPISEWLVSPSTLHMDSSGTGNSDNYPGDIQTSPNGNLVYLANRGHNTIATFAVGKGAPRLIAEIDSGVKWPQNLLVVENELLVAGQNSSLVVSMPLVYGIPIEHRVLFECTGAAWLLPVHQIRNQANVFQVAE